MRDVGVIDPIVSAWDLGSGETAVISYARREPAYEVVIDDAAARACARALGLHVRGTLGLLILAKRTGLIERVTPLLDRMESVGLRVHPSLLREARDLAEEGDA